MHNTVAAGVGILSRLAQLAHLYLATVFRLRYFYSFGRLSGVLFLTEAVGKPPFSFGEVLSM